MMANNTTGNILTKQIHITTLNENRLHNDNKRAANFQNLYNRKIDIAFIQERQSNPIAIKCGKKNGKENLFGTLVQFKKR